MQSGSCSAQPSKPRRFDVGRRGAATKSHGAGFQREDKNMNTIASSSPRRPIKSAAGAATPARTRAGVQLRAPANQSRLAAQKQNAVNSKSAKPKPKNARTAAAAAAAPTRAARAPPPPPPVLPLDPNCNETSLPCLCCDGRSPQDSNSMFNHNHNNNNTVSLRQQMQLPPPPPPVLPPSDDKGPTEEPPPPPRAQEAAADELDNKKVVKEAAVEEEEEGGADIDIEEDEEEGDRDEEDDDDTLVPSCCDCPRSLLEFSLTSSTSSSSTSISSCSDLESDHGGSAASVFSDAAPLNRPRSPERRLPPSLPLDTFSAASSPDEGYPSLDSPSPDYLGVKGEAEVAKLGLLDFLESVGEFGKMERFSQVIQVARWDLEAEQHWDVLRDRLDHLDRLEKVNREVKLAYVARLHEKGCDLGALEEQDLSDVMDEMGNIDIPWKLYKSPAEAMGGSQEFSDAGVDLTAPSDCDDPLAPDSLTPSPVEPPPPPRPPKPPARHASVTSDLHAYINISRETTSMAVSTSPTLSTFSPNSSSPTFTTFRCEKPLPPSPPSVPPLPTSSKPVPYLTLYTAASPPPPVPTPTPPIPPPRRRHLARKEAQRLAALQAEREKTPLSLPPPTTRPPPLPPPPAVAVSLSPPAVPPPPSLPPPPSFHALDVEIRKLLMLAGLTQAELLKLSPELGVCVGGLEDEAEGEAPAVSEERRGFRLCEEERGDGRRPEPSDGWSGRAKMAADGRDDATAEEAKEAQRTTSFTELARRRRRNIGLGADAYYTTSAADPHDPKAFDYPPELLDTPPPPPPPRPLPPIPPSLPATKVSTLPANSARPDRFDWLIAFTPDADAPPPDKKKPPSAPPLPPTSAPKITTFKELRSRGRNGAPPTRVIAAPDPDPTVITPDPDILYNLKWRREKAGSGGSQWEYTSQAQALLLQPPPALTSMAALKEMLQRAEEDGGGGGGGGGGGARPFQKVGCSASDGSLWTTGKAWQREEAEPEVRGRADGGRTLEARTAVSSPPLSLAQPYFLHAAVPPFRPGYFNPQPLPVSRPRAPVGGESGEAGVIGDAAPDWLRPVGKLGVEEAAPGCSTPYKNVDVVDWLASRGGETPARRNIANARTYKELPPVPAYFLRRPPQGCPLHGGAPSRLSPIGALSPPRRWGAPPAGWTASCVSSPLFPRSHAPPPPLCRPPVPPRAPPPRPPKRLQAPPLLRIATVRSVSFGGDVGGGLQRRTEGSWMGEDVRRPTGGLSSLRLQEKKGLVSAVSVAVEAILAQFSSSRTVVQKTLSGDSAINPSLGRLVLQCLCPALHGLLTDGLKPHQSDLISGRRPNSAWGLVQASTRPGPKTQALSGLQLRVGDLPQLRRSKHRFNAFLLGLLNTKLLDFWIAHLQSCTDVLEAFYHPSSFMWLSQTSCQPLFEELLLVLQPLSLLTFNLDLLFQHHHLEPEIPSPPGRDPGPKGTRSEAGSAENLPEVRSGGPEDDGRPKSSPSSAADPDGDGSGSSRRSAQTSPQLMWVQEKEIEELPPPSTEEDSFAQQAGQVIQQGWGAVMRWGGRLSQNLSGGRRSPSGEGSPLPRVQPGSEFSPVAPVPWGLGRLFGASRSPSSPTDHTPTRRPSQWLAPGVSALGRMVSSGGAPTARKIPEPRTEPGATAEEKDEEETEEETAAVKDTPRPLRSVRTLCDHAGTGSELSFAKGEELVVLGGVDQDWIRCRQGDREGLVPIGYTSLIM